MQRLHQRFMLFQGSGNFLFYNDDRNDGRVFFTSHHLHWRIVPVYYPWYKLTIGAKSRKPPTLMHFRTSWTCQDNCDQFFKFNLKMEKSVKSQLQRPLQFAVSTEGRSQCSSCSWWSWWCQLGCQCWGCQWSSVASRPYIRWVGKKHNCRHFQWQSEGRLLFLYDGQGNMLLIV